MKVYYEQDDVQRVVKNAAFDIGQEAAMRILDKILMIPNADAKAIIRGRWVQTSKTSDRCMCSRCFKYFSDLRVSKYGYCPNCGAEMSEK